MALFIDCYNVLHCTHILPSRYAMISVGGLCGLLSRSPWASQRVVVVVDGTPGRDGPDRVSHAVEVIYAGGGKDADTVIEHLIAAESAPRRLTVVSNDRRIQRAARRRRARVMASEQFLLDLIDSLRRPPQKNAKPTDMGDADHWLEAFGFNTDSAGPPEQATTGGDATDADADSPSPASDGSLDDIAGADDWLREFGLEDEDDPDQRGS